MSRRVIGLALVALVALAGAWYLLLWSPQSTALTEARAATAAAVKKQAPLAVRVAELQHEQTLLPGLRARLAVLGQAIPVTPAIDSEIDSINAMSLAAGVVLPTIAPAAAQAKASTAVVAAGPSTITVTMTAIGTYGQLTDFINRLTAAPRLTVVDSLSFGTPVLGKLNLSIDARIFTTVAG